jgi:hypothetical protein
VAKEKSLLDIWVVLTDVKTKVTHLYNKLEKGNGSPGYFRQTDKNTTAIEAMQKSCGSRHKGLDSYIREQQAKEKRLAYAKGEAQGYAHAGQVVTINGKGKQKATAVEKLHAAEDAVRAFRHFCDTLKKNAIAIISTVGFIIMLILEGIKKLHEMGWLK